MAAATRSVAGKKKRQPISPAVERPTAYGLIAVLRAAIADLEGRRHPDLVREDLRRALEER